LPEITGGQTTRRFVLAGLALAALQPDYASALSLGEINVQSTIGQTFVATTTARIGPGESLGPSCIAAFASAVGGAGNIPAELSVSVQKTANPGTYPLRISSQRPMYEPMYEIRLQVSCPGTTNLSKTHFVMLNLPMTSPEKSLGSALPATPGNATVKRLAPAAAEKRSRNTMPQPAPTNPVGRQSVTDKPGTISSAGPSAGPSNAPRLKVIPAGSQYRVERGDTLSMIAQRIAGRAAGSTWQVTQLLFDRNPQAFMDADPNRLKMGYVLDIPDNAALENIGGLATLKANSAQASATTAGTNTSGTPANASGNRFVQLRPENEPATAASTASAPVIEAAKRASRGEPEAANNAATESAAVIAETADNTAATSSPAVSLQSASVVNLNQDQATRAVTEISEPVSFDDTDSAGNSFNDTTAADEKLASAAAALNNSGNDNAAEKNESVIAIGIGILLGGLLALLLLGGKYMAALLPNRRRNGISDAALTDLPQKAASAGAQNSNVAPEFSSETIEMPAHQPAHASDQTISPDVSEPAADFSAAIDVKWDPSPTQDNPTLEELTTSPNQAPRISLRAEDAAPTSESVDFDLSDIAGPLDQTERYSDPESKDGAMDEAEQADTTGTMRNLFSPIAEDTAADVLADAALTTELPGIDMQNYGDSDVTSDLKTLSETAGYNDLDDPLSKTLTQALDLLEQDYEDQLTASQILEQEEVEEAFAKHALKKH
jgi:hypothetical protein